jgi:flagellar biogenesis protein FliO
MIVIPCLVIFGTFVAMRIMDKCCQEEEVLEVIPVIPIGSNNNV